MKSLAQLISEMVHPRQLHQLIRAEPASASVEPEEVLPEEVLVADARGGLTPGQMVDQKVMALLGHNYPGFYSHGLARRGNIRRTPGK
jgi:hypothetical protein